MSAIANSKRWSWIPLNEHWAARTAMLLLLLALPAVVEAQDYTYETNNGTITITRYTGSGSAVTIPGTLNGLPVTSIGDEAFRDCTSLTSLTIPNSVTSIGTWAFDGCISLTNVTIGKAVTSIANEMFQDCTNLTNITIPDSVTNIGVEAFSSCTSLTSVTIPKGVTSIGDDAFKQCYGLTTVTIDGGVIGRFAFVGCNNLSSVTIGSGVTSIGDYAFFGCRGLTSVYFRGNAPSRGSDVFDYWDLGYQVWDPATIYYLPGTTGWGATFGGRPTAPWHLSNPVILDFGSSFGVQTNGFAFIISWATNIPVVVEACTDMANPIWSPIITNTLSGGWCYFSDPQWTNYPGRFYRLRSP